MILPQRGEIWQADLGLVAKVRPVLVLSVAFSDHDYALFHILPHTTTVRGSQFEVAIQAPYLAAGVLNIQGSLSIPRAYFVRRLGMLPTDQLRAVEESISRWLGLR